MLAGIARGVRVTARGAMDGYRETAFCLTLWYAILAALGALLLIALHDVALATGFLIAANAALLFAVILLIRIGWLTDRRIMHGQFWRTLPPWRRAAGEAGLRMARRALEDVGLRFAKGAAAIAIVLSVLAYASNGVSAADWVKAARGPATAQATEAGKSPWNGYRFARLLPTN
jgi:hypothetical protein